jgi:hypothetical protein
MKNYICGFLGVILFTITAENSVGAIDECHPIPQNPAMFSPFVIRASGVFGSSGWQFWPSHIEDMYSISNNHLTIRLVCYQEGDAWATVMTPWQGDIPIDAGLPPGGYRADVILTFRDYGTSETSTTAFVVGPLPSIDSVSPSDTNLVFRWMGDPTLLYSVQYSTQLTANSWKYLPSFSNVTSTSYSQMEYQAPMTNAPLRIYRLISTPK